MWNQIYYQLIEWETKLNSYDFLQTFFNNRFYLILLVIVLLHLKNATYRSLFMSALVNIPGTVLHELMHFLVGWFLNARPCNFNFNIMYD